MILSGRQGCRIDCLCWAGWSLSRANRRNYLEIICKQTSEPENLVRLDHERTQAREHLMRFMVIVKASKETEAGVMPSTEMLAAMGKFNAQLVQAGVMETGEGLHPTAKGARIKYSEGAAKATRGPFDLTNDTVAGFWLINTGSLEEAINWMKRAPFEKGAEIEIRQVFAEEDFGEAFTPELREQEQRLRAELAKQ
jgi:hypothetical protein